ncbi:MAG TPA: hypothetical protein VGF45_20405 [Polyangia bacterium]
MTLNAGWIYGGGAFLISDTSVTSARPPIDVQSSLGQLQLRDDGFVVEEAGAKLVPLGTHAAAALSGDAAGAVAFVLDAQQRLARGDALDKALVDAASSLRHTQPPFPRYVVLVAVWDARPRLLRLDSDDGSLVEPDDVAIEGSLNDATAEGVVRRIGGLPQVNREGHLVAALAFLQNLAASEDLVSQSVAGVFYGLAVDESGVHWAPSTTYLFFHNQADALSKNGFGKVSYRVLDGVCTVGSSYTGNVKCLVPPGTDVRRNEWEAKWGETLNGRRSFEMSKVVVLVRSAGNSIVVLKNDGKHLAADYSDDKPGFRMSPALIERLEWSPTPARPFWFSLGIGQSRD